MSNGKYLYGFINESESKEFGTTILTGKDKKIYTIIYKDIAAVVSDSRDVEYDPTRKNTLMHQKLLLKLMDDYSVIPVAFGIVADSKEDILEILEANYDEFIETLEYVDNKVELGLKVSWDKMYFNIDVQDNEIKELARLIYGKDEDKVINEKIHLGQLIETSVSNKRDQYMSEIYSPLSNLATDSTYKKKLSIKTVLNASFLVDKNEENMFDKFVEEIASRYENKLVFDYTGPWPTFSFVNIKINGRLWE